MPARRIILSIGFPYLWASSVNNGSWISALCLHGPADTMPDDYPLLGKKCFNSFSLESKDALPWSAILLVYLTDL